MNNLTAFEKLLLERFDTLASASSNSLAASGKTSEQLRILSDSFAAQLAAMSKRQTELENSQKRLIEALDKQTRLTEEWQNYTQKLVQQLNALMQERRK